MYTPQTDLYREKKERATTRTSSTWLPWSSFTYEHVEATTWKRQRGSDNLEATTWKRQLGSDNLEATTWKRQLGSDNLEETTWKRQLGRGGWGGLGSQYHKILNFNSTPYKTNTALSESLTTHSPPLGLTRQHGSDNLEATKWKRQSGSDNLEATTCDPYGLPYSIVHI